MITRNRITLLPLVLIPLFLLLFSSGSIARDEQALHGLVKELARKNASRVINWRRSIHEYPELANREFKTAKLVAEHLESLDLDLLRTGVAYTGVVGVLKGGKPGPVVALRADMDALPITEQTGLPFASKVKTQYNGLDVGVMHSCGHDGHTAILMGVAELLASIRDQLAGSVVFIFQPAEEGPPYDEGGGAAMMIEQGVLENPAPEVIFGLHASPQMRAGELGYRKGALMGDESNFRIVIHGRQTHAARPWSGIDPVTIAAQMITALQTIPSRQLPQTEGSSLITIGTIHGGTRRNIIPDDVEMTGTFRTLNANQVDDALARIRRTAESIAHSAGASVTIEIVKELPITYNDPTLVDTMLPTLRAVVGEDKVYETYPVLAAEDFAFYQQNIPGMFFYLGVTSKKADPDKAEPVHSPRFLLDEEALAVGVTTMATLAIDYMNMKGNTVQAD